MSKDSNRFEVKDLEDLANNEPSQIDDPKKLNQALKESETPRNNEASERPRRRFRKELDAALAMETPQGFDFRINGKVIEPNLMQRHFATLAIERKRVGNGSGTGAGKTISALLASRLLNAAVTIFCCPIATVEGWGLLNGITN